MKPVKNEFSCVLEVNYHIKYHTLSEKLEFSPAQLSYSKELKFTFSFILLKKLINNNKNSFIILKKGVFGRFLGPN